MINKACFSYLHGALLLIMPLCSWAQNNLNEQNKPGKGIVQDRNVENEISRLKGILNESSIAFISKKHFASVDLFKLYTSVKNYDSAWRYLHLSDTVYVYNHGGCFSAIQMSTIRSSIMHAELYGLIGDIINLEKSLLKTILVDPSNQSNSDRCDIIKSITTLNRSLLSHTKANVLKQGFAKAIKTSLHDPHNEDKYPESQPYIVWLDTKLYLGSNCDSHNTSANEQVIKKGLFYKMLMELPNK